MLALGNEWRIVRSKCPNLCQQLDEAVSCKKNPEDLDEGCDDHALDASRYDHMGGEEDAPPSPQEREEKRREAEAKPAWLKKERMKDYA